MQYQGNTFPAPLPVTMGRFPERVVDEQAPVKLLDPTNPLLSWPNQITSADFAGWFEERGHGFLDHWDPGYTALTETADPGQDPQRAGLLVVHRGKGHLHLCCVRALSAVPRVSARSLSPAGQLAQRIWFQYQDKLAAQRHPRHSIGFTGSRRISLAACSYLSRPLAHSRNLPARFSSKPRKKSEAFVNRD